MYKVSHAKKILTENNPCTVFQRSKWTPLNVDISNTTGPSHIGYVASERKISWPNFSITIISVGKSQDSVRPHKKKVSLSPPPASLFPPASKKILFFILKFSITKITRHA
jgi:hypothetical protein